MRYSAATREKMLMFMHNRKPITFKDQDIMKKPSDFYLLMNRMIQAGIVNKRKKRRIFQRDSRVRYGLDYPGDVYATRLKQIYEVENGVGTDNPED